MNYYIIVYQRYIAITVVFTANIMTNECRDRDTDDETDG